MGEILTYVAYLLALALFFAILALIGFIGLSLRRAYEYGRRGDRRYRRPLLVGAVGLPALVAAGFGVAHIDGRPVVVLVYSGIVLFLLLFGWSGRLVVPEILGDDH
jgi:hypothetical protein